jgi:hypothetical protein
MCSFAEGSMLSGIVALAKMVYTITKRFESRVRMYMIEETTKTDK